MNKELILTLIKWGPIALLGITFLIGFVVGIIKGRRKSLKGLLYQFIFIVTIFFFTPLITKAVLNIQINGMCVNDYVMDFIEKNETMKDMYEQIPALEDVIKNYPVAVCSMVLFLVLVFVGLPLSFPLYIVYSIIFNIIAKHVFKYSKYEKNENGEYKRNEKGKKIKIKRKKHRLQGGLIKGLEGAIITSFIFMPIGVITRLYRDGKEASSKELSDIEYLKNYKDYLEYLDTFNSSFIGKIVNSGVNKGITGYLTTVTIDGEKTTIEKEASSVLVAAIYIENSGIIELIKDGVDIKTLDLSKLDIDKLDLAIQTLFKSKTLNSLLADGMYYVMNNNLKQTLVEYTDDQDIVSKLRYDNSSAIKEDLLRVTGIVRDIINSRILSLYQTNPDNPVKVINEVKTSDVESILNKVISIKILSEAMPSVATKLLKDKGLTERLTKDDNNEFVKLVLDVVKLVKTLEIESIADFTEGNVMDNLVNKLYIEGAIKSNTVDSLATLLSDATSHKVFDDVIVKFLNDFLDKYEIKLNAKMITNVKTKTEWNNELAVLENIFKLYKDYQDSQVVDFLTANELITKLKETKAMILALPISYQKVFPNLGIEVDLNKIEYIDYEDSNADEQEIRFYTYWRSQLAHFESISDELARLHLESLDDVSLNLLENPYNVTSLAKIVSEIFDTDLIKDGISGLLNDKVKDLLVDYDVNLGDSVIDNVRSVTTDYPYYVEIDDYKYNLRKDDSDRYYLALAANANKDDDVLVTYHDNKVMYNGHNYDVHDNTSYIAWENELTNLSNIATVLKNGDFTTSANLSKILNSLDKMYMLKEAKVDLLVYAVKQLNIMTSEEIDEIDRNTISFTNEKNILLNVIDEYDTLQDVTGDGFSFETIDDETITALSSILDGDRGIFKSKIFGGFVADKIVNILVDTDIRHDKDNLLDTQDNRKLKATIINVSSWEDEINRIRSLLNISSSDEATGIFTTIEESEILNPCKAHVMIKLVTLINTPELDLTVPTVSVLSANSYLQYNKEKNLINRIVGEGNSDGFDGLSFETDDEDSRQNLGELLNLLEDSVIFESKYDNALDTIADPIDNYTEIKDWGFELVENPKETNLDWTDEIEYLYTINGNKEEITSVDYISFATGTNEAKKAVIMRIGGSLDAMDDSNLIKDGSAKNIADHVITELSDGVVTSINKNVNETWTGAFARVLGITIE